MSLGAPARRGLQHDLRHHLTMRIDFGFDEAKGLAGRLPILLQAWHCRQHSVA
jgi:hypothetical protein